MKVSIEKIETFGQGVKAYRIVPQAPSGRTEPERPIQRTDSAKRLGEQLREQLQRAQQGLTDK